MTKLDKLIDNIVNNPKDVRFEDIDKVLKYYGFECRSSKSGSSHYTYFHVSLPDILTIPKDRPIKAVYVKKAISAIQRLDRGEE